MSFVSGNQVSVEPRELVFVAADFSTPKMIAVAAVDDAVLESAEHFDLVSAVVTSGDGFYQGLQVILGDQLVLLPPTSLPIQYHAL